MSDASNNSLVQSAEPAAQVTLAGLNELWQQTRGDPGITIAILDGPVDTTHPSLARAAMTQLDFVGSKPGNGPAEQHGTHTASIIFGQHDSDSPVKGIAPLCRGLIIPIFRNSPQGTVVPCSQADLARAIRAATNAGAHVINVSAGEFASCGVAHPMLAEAVRHCADEGRLIVAAAGNDGCECLHVPGALPSVLAVGAMDDRGEPLPSSNWGEIYQFQGILAPGQRIPGAVPAGGVAAGSGTSSAAAVVSGTAALLLSLQKKRGETPSPSLVRNALLRTAQGCESQVSASCDRLLAGRVNVSGAIQFLTRGVQQMSQHSFAQNSDNTADIIPSQPHRVSVAVTPSSDPGAASVLPSEGGRATPPGDEPPRVPARGPATPQGVAPAACGCGCQNGAKQKVYVIGQLEIDLVSPARRDSLEEQNTGLFFNNDTIYDRNVFLRYLLGWNPDSELAGRRAKHLPPSGSLDIAESVYWVLKQGQCPLYVIRPEGPFAAAAYQQLAVFLIEQSYETYKQFQEAGIGEKCLDDCFYPCYGGQQQHFRDFLSQAPLFAPPEQGPHKQSAKSKDEPEQGSHKQSAKVQELEREQRLDRALTIFVDETQPNVVIAGEIAGKAQLYSGETVEVICPAMRGMQNWNTRRLLELVRQELPESTPDTLLTELRVLLLAVLSKLYELVRNDGKDPCDRAKNYFATAQLFNLATTLTNPIFLRFLGALKPGADINLEEFVNIAINTLDCKPARCARYGAEPFEVELSFYNFANQFMGSAVLAQMVDVSDVVPAALEPRPRLFPRRS
jgi:cyanobactin maturation PatA/PatG family protease